MWQIFNDRFDYCKDSMSQKKIQILRGFFAKNDKKNELHLVWERKSIFLR